MRTLLFHLYVAIFLYVMLLDDMVLCVSSGYCAIEFNIYCQNWSIPVYGVNCGDRIIVDSSCPPSKIVQFTDTNIKLLAEYFWDNKHTCIDENYVNLDNSIIRNHSSGISRPAEILFIESKIEGIISLKWSDLLRLALDWYLTGGTMVFILFSLHPL